LERIAGCGITGESRGNSEREFDLGTRRPLRLLHERANDDAPSAYRRHIKGASNFIAAYWHGLRMMSIAAALHPSYRQSQP
jgi:hypothetical protein